MATKEVLQKRFANLFSGLKERLFKPESEKEKPPVEPIQRLLTMGWHIAQTMGAFDKDALDLLSEEEKTLFAQRLSLTLFDECFPQCPWKAPYLPQERMAAACYYVILSYVEENSDIETTFTEDEDLYGCCIKRAIEYAAVAAVAKMAVDLRQTDQLSLFSYEFQNYCARGSLGVFLLTPRELPLYKPSLTANDEFKQIFAGYRDDIISFRNL